MNCNSNIQTNYYVKPVISTNTAGIYFEKTKVEYMVHIYNGKKNVEDIASATFSENEQYKNLIYHKSISKIETVLKDNQYFALISGTITIKANAKDKTSLDALSPFLDNITLTDKDGKADIYTLNI